MPPTPIFSSTRTGPWFFDAFNSNSFYLGSFSPEVNFSDGANYVLADESLNYHINAPSGFAMSYNTTSGSWSASTATPEPATGILLIAPLAWLAWRKRAG